MDIGAVPISLQVVGNAHDTTDVAGESAFETVYALMEHISPSYTARFASQLVEKLEAVQDLSTTETKG